MNIDYLRTFYHVARIRNFTRAAKELHLTQPAVSQQIQNIENSLGVRLFDRSGGKIKLSAEGAVLLSYAKKIFATIGELEDAFRDLQDLRRGQIGIGATSMMSTYYLPAHIAEFHKNYPNLKINLFISNSYHISEMMHQGNVDLAFGGSSAMHPGLKRQFMHREPLVAVVARDYPLLRTKATFTAADLKGETLILREEGARITCKVMDWFKSHGNGNDMNLMIVNNMEATKALVAHGVGITVLPRHALGGCQKRYELSILPLADFNLHTDYFLLYAPGRELSRPAQAFLGQLYAAGIQLPEDLFTNNAASY